MPPLTLRGVRPSQRQLHHAYQVCRRPLQAKQRQFTACHAPRREKIGPKVNYFEETYGGPVSKRRRMDPEKEEPGAQELKAMITKLEEELQELKSGSLSADSPMLSSMTEEERDSIMEAVKERTKEAVGALEDPVLDDESSQQVQRTKPSSPAKAQDPALVVKMAVPKRDRVYLDRLNSCLQQGAANRSDSTARRELWRWYSRCKQNLPSSLYHIPDKAWELLWGVQYELAPSNPDRAAHLKVLSEDMLGIGRQLDGMQRLAHIESTFLEGQHQKAIEEWEANGEDIGTEDDMLEEYWALGIRMFALQRNPQRAQDLCQLLLQNISTANPRVLLPVINSWNELGSDSDSEHAWNLYVLLRDHLGKDINMEDYDSVSMSFLRAGKKSLALAVFKDMMLTGDPNGEDSATLYKKSLGIVGNLHSVSVTASEANHVSLEALSVLPRKFQNKFFYGSWMKKLLGMGETDAAAMVVELMYERGLKPDPKHLNGIIGAWLRIGNVESRQKAERMAWSMIQERLDFVWQRKLAAKSAQAPTKHSIAEYGDDLPLPQYLRRDVPAATIETLSILLVYYARREMYDKVQQLRNLLEPTELQPNSYFMNHLLYAELRNHTYRKAWERFQKMSRKVQPDMETFACLWDCMKTHVEGIKNSDSRGFPTPRVLFGEMITWYSRLRPRQRELAQEDCTKELCDQVTRCFGLVKDLEGSFVALHGMKASFGIDPSEDTARMVVLQIARMSAPALEAATVSAPRGRRARTGNSNSKTAIARISRVLEMLAKQRKDAHAAKGVDVSNFDENERAAENLNLISDLIRVVLVRTASDKSAVQKGIEKAAWDMGVSGIPLGDNLLSL
ncbi:MAG: hypothetical protein M1819_002821 [Sarea resinae]|nr:MAG: hypothetical protein M1819_002821 [Sarea resinae]